MKRVSLFILLILAFVSFSTFSFADSSPPGIEISINYELPGNIDLLNAENVVIDEVGIAVFYCDQKFWPVNLQAITIYQNNCHYSYILDKSYVNKIKTDYAFLSLSDQFTRLVNKHGIADKEAGFRQDLNSCLF